MGEEKETHQHEFGERETPMDRIFISELKIEHVRHLKDIKHEDGG